MPTKVHLVLERLAENGIPESMRLAPDGYSKHLDTWHRRKDHYGAYRRQTGAAGSIVVQGGSGWDMHPGICDIGGISAVDPPRHGKFAGDRADYQRGLGGIKRLLHGEPSAPRQSGQRDKKGGVR